MSEQDQEQQEQGIQNASSFIIATALFTPLYLYLQVVWLVFLAFGVVAWFSLMKQKEAVADEHKTRYRIFLAAMAASSLIGIVWQVLGS